MKKLVLFSLVLCGLTMTVSAQAKKGVADQKSKSVIPAEKSASQTQIPTPVFLGPASEENKSAVKGSRAQYAKMRQSSK